MPTSAELRPEDAAALAALLTGDGPEYGSYFVPFASYEPAALAERLAAARRDRYRGFWLENRLVGFFMLRGFDDGFARPSFGVYIARDAAGRGLASRALADAIDWCKREDVPALMLKVHPDNTPALQAYLNAGFSAFDTCPRTGHIMMQMQLA